MIKTKKVHRHLFLLFVLLLVGIYMFNTQDILPAAASINDSSGVTVGATYYGGHFDYNANSWVISNDNQCTRIANGEFTAASLGAIISGPCDDDNGLGYQNDIPLHNTVSYAELSNVASSPDYAALGGLAAGTKLEIKYQGRCLIAEKRDVGQGGGPVNGYHRSIDLWWQTAKAIGFKNGFDTMSLKIVSSGTPLTPLGSTTTCQASSSPAATPPAATPTTPTTPSSSAPSSTTKDSTAAPSTTNSATSSSGGGSTGAADTSKTDNTTTDQSNNKESIEQSASTTKASSTMPAKGLKNNKLFIAVYLAALSGAVLLSARSIMESIQEITYKAKRSRPKRQKRARSRA